MEFFIGNDRRAVGRRCVKRPDETEEIDGMVAIALYHIIQTGKREGTHSLLT